MTRRQELAVAFVQALYEDGTLRHDTPITQILQRATDAFARDVAGMMAQRGAVRIADFVEEKAREFTAWLRQQSQ